MAKYKEKIDYKAAQEKGAEIVKEKKERDAKAKEFLKTTKDFKKNELTKSKELAKKNKIKREQKLKK